MANLNTHFYMEAFSDFHRTVNRLSFLKQVDADREDLADEARFCLELSNDLNIVFGENMHHIRFSSGFWTMLSAFITAATTNIFQDIATRNNCSVQHVKFVFFEQFVAVCAQLEQTAVARPSQWFRALFLYRQRRRAESVHHVPIHVLGQETARVRWRNQSGAMVVFEIVTPDAAALL
jgi:hypothetical protein